MKSKDASRSLRGKWFVELVEFKYKRKTQIEAIKALILWTHENCPPAFSREEIIQPRICIFWGTNDKDDYLNDEMCKHRFLPIKINAIKLEELKEARDAIWRMVVSAYWPAEASLLTGNLSKIAAGEANDRMEQDQCCELRLEHMAGMAEASFS